MTFISSGCVTLTHSLMTLSLKFVVVESKIQRQMKLFFARSYLGIISPRYKFYAGEVENRWRNELEIVL